MKAPIKREPSAEEIKDVRDKIFCAAPEYDTAKLKVYLRGFVNARVIKFIFEYLESKNMDTTSVQSIINIPECAIEQGWLSIPSCKELYLLQQELKKNLVKPE